MTRVCAALNGIGRPSFTVEPLAEFTRSAYPVLADRLPGDFSVVVGKRVSDAAPLNPPGGSFSQVDTGTTASGTLRGGSPVRRR